MGGAYSLMLLIIVWRILLLLFLFLLELDVSLINIVTFPSFLKLGSDIGGNRIVRDLLLRRDQLNFLVRFELK